MTRENIQRLDLHWALTVNERKHAISLAQLLKRRISASTHCDWAERGEQTTIKNSARCRASSITVLQIRCRWQLFPITENGIQPLRH